MKKQSVRIILFAIITAALVFALSSCAIYDTIMGMICEHEWVDTEINDATCTEDGSIVRQCKKCHLTATEVLHATEHSYNLDEYGYREEDGHAHVCSLCGAHGEITEHISGGPATAEEHETCSECGYILSPALNHVHEYNILESDATYHWYECVCGEESAVSAHTGGSAKCDAAAICDVCGESYGSFNFTNHTLYVVSEVKATCAMGGLKVTACSGCGYTINETSEHLDHVWSVSEISCTIGKACTREGCGTVVPASGHSYELTSTTAATCTEDGIATYTCSICSDSYTNVVEHSHGHSVSKWTLATEELISGETCKYVLTYEGACDSCSEPATKTETAERHEYRVTVALPATCTRAGVKTYTCSVAGCGHSYNDVYNDGAAHSWDGGVTADGVTTYTCSTCTETRTVISSKTETNSSVSSETLKDVGEVELKDASIALDKETADALNGNVSISASTQKKEEITDVEISPEMEEQIGESDIFEFTMSDDNGAVESFAGKVTVKIPYTLTADDDPDCIAVWWLTEDADGNPTLQYVEAKYAGGFVVFEAEHFSYYTVTRMTPAERCAYRGHEDRVLIYGATCTEDGYETHICLRCGRTEVVKGESAKGHDFEEEYNEEATCTKHGKVGHKCNSCGKKTEEKKPAGGHEWKLESSAEASCTAPGHTTNKCGKCGELDSAVIPQKSHNYQPTTVEPTCTEYGYTLYTCDHCSSTKKDDYVNPKGHNYSEVRVEPTCTEDGYVKKICACGDEKSEKIKKNGHTWNADNATCGEAKYCLVCEFVDKAATGKHNMKDGICKVCGAGCDHKYVETERIEATCISDGRIVKTCSCGSRTIELIAKLEHTYNMDAPTCGEDKICTMCKTVFASATGLHTMVEGVCSVCGDVCEHSFAVVSVVAPKCESEGYTTERCYICGVEKKTNVTPALGHTDGKICVRCDKILVEGATGYYTNMVDSFLNLKLNVALRDVVIYPEGTKIGQNAKIDLKELWLTEDENGNIIGYGEAIMTVTYNGEYQEGVMKASVVNDMLYVRLDVDGGDNTNQHNALAFPLDGTSNPVGAIGSIYKWYKAELYPILSAMIAANVPAADRIIGGFMNAIFAETALADGGYAYTLDLDKVLEFNKLLSEKSIKEIYEDVLGGNLADLEASVLDLLDKTVYEALGLLSDEGISREDMLGAVFSFMEMMGNTGDIDRDEAIANAMAHGDMNKTLAEVLAMTTGFSGTTEELKTMISGAFAELGNVSVYGMILPAFGLSVTETNVGIVRDEIDKVITEAFGYFTFSTELKADGRINAIKLALMNNTYVTGEATIYFGFNTDKIPENVISDIEMLDKIIADLNRGEYTDSFYVVNGSKNRDNYGTEWYSFIAFTIEEALEIAERYELTNVNLVRQQVVANSEGFINNGIMIDGYCGWINFDINYSADAGAFHMETYRVNIAEDGSVTEELLEEGFETYLNVSLYYDTETGDWASQIPYELRRHDIVELKDKRIEPVGCEGLGKAYYYCTKCGVEYSVDIYNGHSWDSTLELVDPAKGCEGGVNATHTCTACGEVVSETFYNHYEATLVRIDLEEHGCCGGYLEITQCACGYTGSFDRYDAKCSWTWYSSMEGTGEICRCQKCGLTITEKFNEVVEGCFRVRYDTVNVSKDGVDLIDDYTFISHRYEQHRYEATFELYGESCEDGYKVRYTCSACGDSYESSGSGHRTFPSTYIDIAEHGGCGGYVQVYTCACGEVAWHEQNLNCDLRHSSNSYYDDQLGCIVYVDASTCVNCGCRLQRTYYSVEVGPCSYVRYNTYILNVGDVAASYKATESYEAHDFRMTAVLDPGAVNCEGGVTLVYTCSDCGYSYSEHTDWHQEYDIEKIDLSELGCVCGGYAVIRGCACGYRLELRLDECLCELDQSWYLDGARPEGAIESGWQWSTSGEQYFNYDAYMYVCAVTDPERCGYIIRYIDYWKKDGCYAERYRTYQFGYDPETGECAYEFAYKYDEKQYEKRQHHAYGEGVTTNNGNTTTTIYTCLDCGSTYTQIHTHGSDTEYVSRYEYIAENKFDSTYPLSYERYVEERNNFREEYYTFTCADGRVEDYKYTYNYESYNAPFGTDGYKVIHKYSGSLAEKYTSEIAYTHIMGHELQIYSSYVYENGYWSRHDYTYNVNKPCERTETYSDSEGNGYTDSGIFHRWIWMHENPTCTQDGGEHSRCIFCNHTEFKSHEPAYGHAWVSYGDSYVCNRCGLENVNGSDGEVVLEDLTWKYGGGDNYVVGYYSREYISFIYSVSLLVKGADGEFEEIFLDDIEIGDHATLRAKVFSIEAVKAAATELGYDSDDYLIRFAFVPLGADGSFDYAITFEEFDPLSDVITGNSLIAKQVGYGETVNISIVPEKSGYFRIVSTCEGGDPYANLYDAYGNHIESNDDGAGNLNFLIEVYLEAGATYTLSIRWLGNDVSGVIPVQSTFSAK